MKEHPIIMTAESVLATLNGLKTQTRRVVTPQPPEGFAIVPRGDIEGWMQLRVRAVSHYPVTVTNVRCPYGVPGDRLWVRETWCQKTDDDDRFVYNAEGNLDPSCCWYKASNPEVILCPGLEMGYRKDGSERSPWMSPIHMPRWASRITLEITDVRVQRVQEISEADIIAEGCPKAYLLGRNWYQPLWDTINAKRGYPWKSNPWVWAVTYKLLEVKGRVAA